MKLRSLRFIWNLWPPFVGLGISVKEISKDYKKVTMVLKKRPWNVNYFGTQYGGGIFSMTDGVHMLMLVRNLPKKYRIWDKSASIEYLKRGKTTLTAEFVITDQDIEFIEREMAEKSALDWVATVDVFDANGQTIAQVTRTLSIKLKSRASLKKEPKLRKNL